MMYIFVCDILKANRQYTKNGRKHESTNWHDKPLKSEEV